MKYIFLYYLFKILVINCIKLLIFQWFILKIKLFFIFKLELQKYKY